MKRDLLSKQEWDFICQTLNMPENALFTGCSKFLRPPSISVTDRPTLPKEAHRETITISEKGK